MVRLVTYVTVKCHFPGSRWTSRAGLAKHVPVSNPTLKPFARARWPHWPAACVLLAGCAATVVLCVWLRGKALAADRARLHEEAVMQMEAIDTRIELFVEMLQRFQDQITRTPGLDAEHWDGLVLELNLRGNYHGLAAAGFWLYQPPEAPLQWRETWPALGLRPPHHSGWPSKGQFIRSFHSTVYDNPAQPFQTISTTESFAPDENLWEKIAWNVGVGPGALPGQEVFDGRSNKPDRGFRILLAVFYPERHPRALIQERLTGAIIGSQVHGSDLITQNDWGNFRGILYGEFALKQFVASTLGTRPRGVEFVVYDVQADWHENPEAVFMPIYGEPNTPGEKHYLEERLEMKHYGRRLVFDFHTTPAFFPHSLRRLPLMAALIGGCLTLLAAGLVFGQTQARLREAADADRLRAANERLEAALRDRERISRELHDGALQSIYAVGLALAHCRNMSATQPERVPALISGTMESINVLVTELRQFLLTLEAEVLEGGSLEPMLNALARRVEATTPTRVAMQIDSAVAAALPAAQSPHLINLVREAVSNSIRHGEPTEVRVNLSAADGGWRLEIRDDGSGFDPALVEGTAGHGLRNMQARAAELGASFVLESKPGSGTLVRVECGVAQS
jgi:signal transduction histidine kinase